MYGWKRLKKVGFKIESVIESFRYVVRLHVSGATVRASTSRYIHSTAFRSSTFEFSELGRLKNRCNGLKWNCIRNKAKLLFQIFCTGSVSDKVLGGMIFCDVHMHKSHWVSGKWSLFPTVDPFIVDPSLDGPSRQSGSPNPAKIF